MIDYIHPINPEIRKLKYISERLLDGDVYIFPTDTVYALIADSTSKEGIETIFSIKKMNKNHPLSILCKDISEVSEYVEYLPNFAFKLMKKVTPGPYTFIFKAGKNLLRYNISNKKLRTIGIRVPDNIYIQELLKIHPNPLTSTSVVTDDEYITDIDELDLNYGTRVAAIIDGGIISVEMSTIIDCTGNELEIIREGKGIELIH